MENFLTSVKQCINREVIMTHHNPNHNQNHSSQPETFFARFHFLFFLFGNLDASRLEPFGTGQFLGCFGVAVAARTAAEPFFSLFPLCRFGEPTSTGTSCSTSSTGRSTGASTLGLQPKTFGAHSPPGFVVEGDAEAFRPRPHFGNLRVLCGLGFLLGGFWGLSFLLSVSLRFRFSISRSFSTGRFAFLCGLVSGRLRARCAPLIVQIRGCIVLRRNLCISLGFRFSFLLCSP